MEYLIDREYEDVRLDKFLRKQLPNLPLTEIFKGIRVGKIKVNGKKSKENYRLQLNDVVKVFLKVDIEEEKVEIRKIKDSDLDEIKSLLSMKMKRF